MQRNSDMGLYNNKLAEMSDPNRRHRRVVRRPSPVTKTRRPPRDAGWNAGRAQTWAKPRGYPYSKVDVTDQHVRPRQFDPKGLKVKRTITLGRGTQAVVAREEKSMATIQEARRRRRSRATKAVAARPRRRHAREATVAEARKPLRHRKKSAVTRTKTRTKRRGTRRPAAGQMMAPRKRTTRRRRARKVEAWHGNPVGHRKAAKKGWTRRKTRKTRKTRRVRESAVSEARRSPRRRRARSTQVHTKRRRRHMREPAVMQASRRRRHYARAPGASKGLEAAELAVAVLSGGLGFVAADALDRFLATYDPSATTPLPTDKFTSSGAGTLANTLNVAAMPDWKRVAAVVGAAVVPAIGSVYVEHPLAKSALEGFTVGVGVKAFQLLWNNVLMPMLKPKDTSPAGLQKSVIARLYPAEVAASINLATKTTSGSLSQPPAGFGVGAPDVGPFALSDESPYASVLQALQNQTGLQGSSPYPDAAQALRRQAGMSGPGTQTQMPTLQQVTGGPDNRASGLSQPPGYQPGPGSTTGPGPQDGSGVCNSCLGDNNEFLGFIGDAEDDRPMPFLNGAA